MASVVKFKKVTHVFLSGKLSSTIIIPIDTARKYGLDRPANVIVRSGKMGFSDQTSGNFGMNNQQVDTLRVINVLYRHMAEKHCRQYLRIHRKRST